MSRIGGLTRTVLLVLVTMVAATDVSSGVYPSVLAPSGDIEKLFANLPIYNTVIESAITGGRR